MGDNFHGSFRMVIKSDLRQVIYALSDALDLVGVDDVAHGKRVGVMAAECAKIMGMPPEEVLFLFDIGLLHDIGVSTTTTHQHLVSEFDWEGSQSHALMGHDLLKDFPPLARMALPIKYHHTRWDIMQSRGVSEKVALQANLILLVDRVDALAAPYYSSGKVLQHRKVIWQEIIARESTYFSPALVEAFLAISKHEAFWLQLETAALTSYLNTVLAIAKPYEASNAELLQLAAIFARIVDAKSTFTYTHSQGVAKVARRLAELLGLSDERCDMLEIAALLHDLGKLRVPDEILDKPAILDEDERLVMNTHSFETMLILNKIKGFEEIVAWAASHHEAPGRSGYPYGLESTELPLEARILRVADIFQAMVQDRPYRKGLSKDAVADFMQQLQANGRIEAMIGDVLNANLDEMIVKARLHETESPLIS